MNAHRLWVWGLSFSLLINAATPLLASQSDDKDRTRTTQKSSKKESQDTKADSKGSSYVEPVALILTPLLAGGVFMGIPVSDDESETEPDALKQKVSDSLNQLSNIEAKTTPESTFPIFPPTSIHRSRIPQKKKKKKKRIVNLGDNDASAPFDTSSVVSGHTIASKEGGIRDNHDSMTQPNDPNVLHPPPLNPSANLSVDGQNKAFNPQHLASHDHLQPFPTNGPPKRQNLYPILGNSVNTIQPTTNQMPQMSVISEIHQVRPEDEIKEEHLESEVEDRNKKDVKQDPNKLEKKNLVNKLFGKFKFKNTKNTGSKRSESNSSTQAPTESKNNLFMSFRNNKKEKDKNSEVHDTTDDEMEP